MKTSLSRRGAVSVGLCSSFKVKVPSGSDKTAAAFTLISAAAEDYFY